MCHSKYWHLECSPLILYWSNQPKLSKTSYECCFGLNSTKYQYYLFNFKPIIFFFDHYLYCENWSFEYYYSLTVNWTRPMIFVASVHYFARHVRNWLNLNHSSSLFQLNYRSSISFNQIEPTDFQSHCLNLLKSSLFGCHRCLAELQCCPSFEFEC